MKKGQTANDALTEQIQGVELALLLHVAQRRPLAIVKAPPGSGKTHLLMGAARCGVSLGMRVAVATQTNSQADDICCRLASENVPCVRFASSSQPQTNLGGSVVWATKASELLSAPRLVIGTSAKWGLVKGLVPFDFLFVEEAWQLGWADFMLLGQVSERFVLIGDPGQVPPVVTTDVSRWATAPRPPHRAAPEVILDGGMDLLSLSLPVSRRLPSDTVDLIRSFYSFGFQALSRPGERSVEAGGRSRGPRDRVLDLLREGSAAGYTLPTPDSGPPLECDTEMAAEAVALVQRLLERKTSCLIDGERKVLVPEDIGLCATHRVMNSSMQMQLPSYLKGVRVDTPERWQGLECKVIIMVHPLSGVVTPSDFDLETGRLCVMASRHKAGLIVLTRDHLTETLEEFLPRSEQPVGHPDIAGRGHARNMAFWAGLEGAGRVVVGGR